MKITKIETFLTNAGFRNYLFVRLSTDNGLSGLGEASLEWQEKTVQTLIHEWVEDRILGTNPFDIEQTIGNMIRDQYQGGSTILTAISGVEIALWDIIGKACGQPVYNLLGGRCREQFPSYANGWYGGAITPDEYALKAAKVVSTGYRAMKIDPFGTAWKTFSHDQMQECEAIVSAVREAVGPDTDILLEAHGRFSTAPAIEIGKCLAKYNPGWYEEPISPYSVELLKEVKHAQPIKIAAGERFYMLEDFNRLISTRAIDVLQMDLAHCGGLWVGKKAAAIAQINDVEISPHCSIGPVALCAAVHFGWSTPNVTVQENFAEYDVPWRNDLVCGWNPIDHGYFKLPDKPGLGIELDTKVCQDHPYKKNAFPSLWDSSWLTGFTQKDRKG